MPGSHLLRHDDRPPQASLFESATRLAVGLARAAGGWLSAANARDERLLASVGTPECSPALARAAARHAGGPHPVFVEDLRADPALAAFAGRARSLAIWPLADPRGRRIGTLCITDPALPGFDPAAEPMVRMADHATTLLRARPARPADDLYRGIVEEQVELISLATEDGQLLFVNRAYGRVFDCAASALVGTSLYEMIAPDDRAAVRAQIDHVMRTGAVRQGENRTVLPDGSVRWMSWINSRTEDAAGRPLLQSVGRDVTVQRELEMRLADSERFVRQVADNAPVSIVYVDRERRYRFVNAAHARRHGQDAGAMIGCRRDEVIGEPDPVMRRHVDAALAAGRSTSRSRNSTATSRAASSTGWCPTARPTARSAASSPSAST